jgi:type IV fimbrial biogenesis protein FimT
MAHLQSGQPDSGLTLLELVVTLAVLAVLGALTLPGMGSQMDRQRLRNAAQSLVGDLSEARYLAAQRRQVLHVTARDHAPWCWAVASTSGCDCNAPQACTIHAVPASDHAGIKLLQPLDVSFDPTGMPSSTASTTFESPRGDRLRVEVSVQGRARVCAAAGNWPQLPSC